MPEDNNQKLKKTIADLEDRVKELEEVHFQLKYPLDVTSKKIIKDIIELPVTVKLKGTDAATAGNYGKFFVNPFGKALTVSYISEVHGTAGTDGSAVTLQIERLQGTEALDSGDTLLSTAFDLKGTINTVQYGVLVSNGQLLQLNKGDRLALKDSGVLTAVADVVITIILKL